MQDFWLINGFFLGLGLLYTIISLIFIFSTKPNSRVSKNELVTKTIDANISNRIVGDNLLITGLMIGSTAALLLIFGQSISLLTITVINLVVTFVAHLSHVIRRNLEIAPMTIYTHNHPESMEDELSGKISRGDSVPNDLSTEIIQTNVPKAIAAQPALIHKFSITLSPEIFAELMEISSDPAAAVDEAIRWWLRRRMVDEDSTSTSRKGVGSRNNWRSQQQNWND